MPSKPLHTAFEQDYQDPAFVVSLLNECLQEEDLAVFFRVLRDIARANHLEITDLAHKSKLGRRTLHRLLAGEGNPTLNTLNTFLDTLGFQLAIQMKEVS